MLQLPNDLSLVPDSAKSKVIVYSDIFGSTVEVGAQFFFLLLSSIIIFETAKEVPQQAILQVRSRELVLFLFVIIRESS